MGGIIKYVIKQFTKKSNKLLFISFDYDTEN